MIKTRLFIAMVISIFMITISTLTVSADNNVKLKKHNQNSHYVQQCTDVPSLKADLVNAQQVYWDAEESIRLLKLDIQTSTGATKKEYKRLLKLDQKLFWDAEGEIKWVKKELAKLEKFCYGDKPKHKNEHSWGKKASNWVSGWFHFGKVNAKGDK